ncbi:MAG: hypothetical protein K2J04_09650, partial [Lachnospiraceae bacterium]|nr:hypothetical protein [Lachnospiraceae bacterium]
NGSGESTIMQMAKIGGEYINADDIKRTILCTDLEAAVKAEELREYMRRSTGRAWCSRRKNQVKIRQGACFDTEIS